MLPLGDATLIARVMRALLKVSADIRALLTDKASAPRLANEARAEGFELFVGSDFDVLARYCDACRSFDVSRVVRATGDNPFVSPFLANAIMRIHEEHGADLSHYLGCPWGSGVEVVESRALYAAEAEAGNPEEREHLTTYLYRHRGRFRIQEPDAPPQMHAPDVRVTVDTPEDYESAKRIFSELFRGEPIETDRIIAWTRRSERLTE
jgi:spore coat polysaccharide biosynthesis protein SpsF